MTLTMDCVDIGSIKLGNALTYAIYEGDLEKVKTIYAMEKDLFFSNTCFADTAVFEEQLHIAEYIILEVGNLKDDEYLEHLLTCLVTRDYKALLEHVISIFPDADLSLAFAVAIQLDDRELVDYFMDVHGLNGESLICEYPYGYDTPLQSWVDPEEEDDYLDFEERLLKIQYYIEKLSLGNGYFKQDDNYELELARKLEDTRIYDLITTAMESNP